MTGRCRCVGSRLRRGLAVLGIALVPSIVAALPDDPDLAWATNGTFKLDLPNAYMSDFIVLRDGSIVGTTSCDGSFHVGMRGAFRLGTSGVFDETFGVDGYAPCPAVMLIGGVARIAATSDGRIVVAKRSIGGATSSIAVARYTRTGSLDPAFGQNGVVRAPENIALQEAASLAVDAQDRIVAGITLNCETVPHCTPMLARWRTDGTPDAAFGNGGHVLLPIHGRPGGLVVHADSRISVALDDRNRIQVARLLDDGSLDPTFGTGGIVSVPPWAGTTQTTGIVLQDDGRIVVSGSLALPWLPQGEGALALFLARFTDRGALDYSFGSGGVLIPRTLGDAMAPGLALQADGKLLLAGAEIVASPFGPGRLFVARFHRDGSPDLSFAGGGVASLGASHDYFESRVRVGPDGAIFVADAVVERQAQGALASFRFIRRLLGGSTPLPRLFRDETLVEYFHAGFGHYFLTGLGPEIEKLDVIAPGGWARTGHAFRVFIEGLGDVVPVCRFFSDQSFAPKSSHFYTPYANECAGLKAGSVWRYEGDTFHLQLPWATACPFGSQPLYRAYNNGLSGAPNHRYTIDASVLDAMIAQGWVMEGDSATRIFACVPRQG